MSSFVVVFWGGLQSFRREYNTDIFFFLFAIFLPCPWSIHQNINEGGHEGDPRSKVRLVCAFDVGSVFMSQVAAGREIESGVGLYKNGSPASLSI